jgi:4-amino-4-deoxy-L-arabinose transferase-like glycosyltransferase
VSPAASVTGEGDIAASRFRWGLGLLVAAGALLFLPALGAAPFERAEIYFLDAARAMVERGDWLVPRYRGEPFFDKPALTYWLMGGAFRLLGFDPGSARLVSALAAVGAVLATAWIGLQLFDRRAALAGGLALMTTVAFMAFSRVAMSDMLLTAWSTLAFGCALAMYGPQRPTWAAVALGLVLGLGFLTKGPVAVLLPGLGVLCLAVLRRRSGLPLTRAGLLLGLAAFAVAGLAWFAALYWRLGPEPLAYFFLRENVERFAGETYDADRPPWFYLAVYLAEGAPWSLLLPAAAWRLLRSRGPDRAPARLLLCWMGLMAVPLSLSRGKIDYYLLPLYPAASLVVGRYLARGGWVRADRAWARGVLVLGALALAAAPWLVVRVPGEWLPLAAPELLAALLFGGGLALAWAAARPTPARTASALAGVCAAAFLAAVAAFLPAFHGAQPQDAVLADVQRERHYRPDASLAYCADRARVQREILFHARLAGHHRCDLWAPAASRLPFLLILEPRELPSLSSVPTLREVARYRYLPATALTLRGLLGAPAPETMVLAANYPTDDPLAEVKRKRDRKRALRAVEEPGTTR